MGRLSALRSRRARFAPRSIHWATVSSRPSRMERSSPSPTINLGRQAMKCRLVIMCLSRSKPGKPSACDDPNNPNCIRRVGRFGWKNQHATLVSFSGDAYLNEMGITNLLVPNENTSLGRFVGFGTPFDVVPDNTPCDANPSQICGEDPAEDIRVFAEFMRATKAPPRDPDINSQFAADVNAGAALFSTMVVNGTPHYSCSVCHVPSIVTAPRCTVINGGTSVCTALPQK